MRILGASPINQNNKNNNIAFGNETQLKWLTNRISITELNDAMKNAKSGMTNPLKNLFTKKHEIVRLQASKNGYNINDNNTHELLSFSFINRKDNETVFFESTPNSITYRNEKPLGVFKNLTYSYNNGEILRTETTGLNGTTYKPKIEKLVEGANRFEKII